MNQKELESQIRQFVTRFKELDQIWNDFEKSSGANIEGPLGLALWKTFDAYTTEFSERIDDNGRWVEWFIYENRCGEAKLTAEIAGHEQVVTNVRQIARIILEEAKK